MREPYYIDTLIDRLLFPPASMTVGNLQKLHSECAEMLLLFRNTPSSADAIRAAVEADGAVHVVAKIGWWVPKP